MFVQKDFKMSTGFIHPTPFAPIEGIPRICPPLSYDKDKHHYNFYYNH